MSLSQRIRPNSEAAPWVVEEVKELEQELSDLRATLDLVFAANQRAIKAWQATHPEHGDMVWPDQAALVGWLLERSAKDKARLDWIERNEHLLQVGDRSPSDSGDWAWWVLHHSNGHVCVSRDKGKPSLVLPSATLRAAIDAAMKEIPV